MTATVIPFQASPAIARVVITVGGWRIDLTSPAVRKSLYFAGEGDTAEHAQALRDEGGWTLRFGPGAAGVRAILKEIDAEGDE